MVMPSIYMREGFQYKNDYRDVPETHPWSINRPRRPQTRLCRRLHARRRRESRSTEGAFHRKQQHGIGRHLRLHRRRARSRVWQNLWLADAGTNNGFYHADIDPTSTYALIIYGDARNVGAHILYLPLDAQATTKDGILLEGRDGKRGDADGNNPLIIKETSLRIVGLFPAVIPWIRQPGLSRSNRTGAMRSPLRAARTPSSPMMVGFT